MAHLVTFALLLLPLYAPSATAFTYWVDGSCTSRPEFNVAMNEARLMARHGFLKLKSDSDTDYHNVFQQTFQTPRSDNTKYDVKNNQFDEFSFNDTPQRLLLCIMLYLLLIRLLYTDYFLQIFWVELVGIGHRQTTG